MRKLAIVIGVGLLLCCGQSAWAQRRPGRYYPPYGPTLSPYLQYYNRPVGVFGNYYTFVRPEVQLRAEQRSQDRQLRVLDAQLRAAEASRIREEEVAPTGTGSVYMNYSHYYPTVQR